MQSWKITLMERRHGGMHCFPQCMPAIHSTRVQNLRLTLPASSRRTSSVRRQNAISRSGFSRSLHLKPRRAANQGLAAPAAHTIPDAGSPGYRQHVHDRDAIRPSVLSSSLARASPPGRCERAMTASPCRDLSWKGKISVRSFDRITARLPSALYLDHAPPLRCLNHVVDRTTHRDCDSRLPQRLRR